MRHRPGTARRVLLQALFFLSVLWVWALDCSTVSASPAPAPLLQSPPNAAANFDPDPTLSWRWIDELMVNGSFETGTAPGWSTAGTNPAIWQIQVSNTNAYGMGYRWATTFMPRLPTSRGQLIQNIFIPLNATSATLAWKERIWNQLPSQLIGRLRVLLYENGSALVLLDDATGSEPVYLTHNWVSHSTNLLAYAGRNLQVVLQADGYSPLTADAWFADVDGFSLSCEHPNRPDFQVCISKSPVLGPADQVSQTADLSFSSVVLDPLATYYWRVSSVREGVTNYSTTNWFRTGQRVLPRLAVTAITDLGVQLQFTTHLNRFYIVERTDSPDGTSPWYAATVAFPGTGGLLQAEVLRPDSAGYWRLRIFP